MEHLTKAQRSRKAVATFKTLADAVIVEGYYCPSNTAGKKLANVLCELSPEIYGTMTDPRMVELKGLEYVVNRMPLGIEKCEKIVLTTLDDFENSTFELRIPLKRRRLTYAVSDEEMCFVITRGESEVYDILTHIVFLNIEAAKIHNHIHSQVEGIDGDWARIKEIVETDAELEGAELDQAVWNLSKFLGRSYKTTREVYESLEQSRKENNANNSLFSIIYEIGRRAEQNSQKTLNCFEIICAPALNDTIVQHKYAAAWANSVKKHVSEEGLSGRPLHVVSANLHSFRNILYAPGFLQSIKEEVPQDIYEMIKAVRGQEDGLISYAQENGFSELKDLSGANIDVHFIDGSKIQEVHPSLDIQLGANAPVLVVMDYAFGTQAFKVMDELLREQSEYPNFSLDIDSISIMGKAGTLRGKKGDIMLATAHVLEGTPDNYRVANDVCEENFSSKPENIEVYIGTMLTVLGTSLQNSTMLDRFLHSGWGMVGLEMEGGHYQRAINASLIRGRISDDVKIRYAYYASDNPLLSGQTLASGPMGEGGIVPTYLISKVFLEKIYSKKSH